MIELFKLYLTIFFVLFLPGYFLYILILSKKPKFNLKTLAFSIALSLFVINFLVILINKIGIPINFFGLAVSIIAFLGLCIFLIRKKIKVNCLSKTCPLALLRFKKIKLRQKEILLVLIILFAVILRLFFLSDRLTPHTTDLGHHMYWSNYIVEFQHLPTYDMPDFIIGEHIIFGIISILSGSSVISSMPVAILFIINIFSLLAIYLLAKELTRKIFKTKDNFIPLLALLAIGVFYSSSSPQSNYVSGGVIGNLIGNFLIPMSLLCLTRAIFNKSRKFALIFFLILACLGFTHHLSSFIFLYSIIGYLFFLILFLFIKYLQKKITLFEIKDLITARLKTFFCWKNIIILLLIMGWVLIIHTPSYLNPSAINVAVGNPSKETRFGLTLHEIISTGGSWRIFYSLIGFIGLLLLTFKQKRFNKISVAILPIMWFLMIFAMSYKPGWLKVDIPSNRIGSYLVYPASLLSAFGVFYLLKINKKSPTIFNLLFLIVFASGIISGLSEFTINKKTTSKDHEIYQTFIAAQYLKNIIPDKNQKVLKDHNYLQGDTWMKLFFMQEYKFPLSRSLLRRYNDPVKPRETCTRDMISIPDSKIGKDCFDEYKVKYIVLKKGYDDEALLGSQDFSPIYINDTVVIFQKN